MTRLADTVDGVIGVDPTATPWPPQPPIGSAGPGADRGGGRPGPCWSCRGWGRSAPPSAGELVSRLKRAVARQPFKLLDAMAAWEARS
jgi:hypothetical protein